MKLVRFLLLVLVGFSGFPGTASAQEPSPQLAGTSVPRLVNYSGRLIDVQGKTVTGMAGITFAVYKDQYAGPPLWLETQNVQVDARGNYTVQLGATKSDGLPLELFTSGEARWIGAQVQGQEEQPRIRLLSVPYALRAGDAQTVGGLPASAFVLAPPPATASAATVPGDSAASAPPPSSSVTGTGSAGLLPLWDSASDIITSVLSQSGSGSTAKVGINTTTPATTLDVKGSATVRGTLSLPANGTAKASGGKNSEPMTLTASAFNSDSGTAVKQNFQWLAEPVGNDSSTASGSLNLLFGQGSNKAAETGLQISSAGLFTFAPGQTFPGTIAAVTAGTDLVAGGSSGNVILNLDLTKVPLLATSNTFAATQTISSGDLALTAGNLDLPITGVINLGGTPFISSSASLTGNTSVGFNGLNPNTGNVNTAVGFEALHSNQTGVANTALGFQALTANTTGSKNTAVGDAALIFLNGNSNTAVGHSALFESAGSSNTAIGDNAGNTTNTTVTTGSNNTFVGANSTPGTQTSLSNAAAIGANAQVTASNAMVLGSINGVNGATADTFVGIGTTAPTAKLDVHGTANFTGAITFAAGQVFPGTITGVTAGTDLLGSSSAGNVTLNVDTTKVVTAVNPGTDLTGGGTGGSVMLSLDTSKLPQLSGGNSFIGNQTVTGNVGASGTISSTGLSVVSNSQTLTVGNLGCSSGFIGIAFGSAPSCGTYSMVGNGTDTILNRPAGGSMVFRENNATQMSIAAGGAVTINGSLNVKGALSKGSGSFKIDHPLDPLNKYLYHSFVESPDMMNVYNGNVTTDRHGLANVVLPDYFEALNRDFRYQLTVIGQFAQVIVARKIRNNRFVIKTNRPRVEVSWQVTGIRQDPYANAHRIPVEEEKPEEVRGHYLHPDAYMDEHATVAAIPAR
ncbi:MAG: hypothetical protein WB952_08605 [Terriglobales bacterium]